MELPDPPFFRRWSFILASVIGLAAIAALVGWRGLVAPPATSTTTTTVSTPPTTVTPTTSQSSSGPTSRPDDILWQAEGSDVMTSDGFKAPSVWRIEWSFDCSNFRKFGAGTFKITGNGDFKRIQIQSNEIEASGTEPFTRGGFGQLSVDSVCKRWTVRVLSG